MLLAPFLVIFVAIFALLGEQVFSARNEREEAICQPFLTSRRTSPLVENDISKPMHLRRNLKVDEDGDFACRLVLQDPTLPAQIRVTINEGLFWLAVRHVQMGLPEHRIVANQAKILARMLSNVHHFSLTSAHWHMDDNVRDYSIAAEDFQNALYGEAKPSADPKADSKQRSSPVELYKAHREFARALGSLGRYRDAVREYVKVLDENAHDFGAVFGLRQCLAALSTAGAASVEATDQLSHDEKAAVDRVLEASGRAYRQIAKEAKNSYAGYSPSDSSETILEFDGVNSFPSKDRVNELIAQRRPFVVRGAVPSLISSDIRPTNEFSGWKVHEWVNSSSLLRKVGASTEVSVEVKSRTDEESPIYGFGVDIGKKVVSFGDLLENIDKEDDAVGKGKKGHAYYLNTQDRACGNGFYRCPLHQLRDDFPINYNDSTSIFSDIFANMTEISLWIGNSRKEWTHSRMHMDATDNLYFMLHGTKKFLLISPAFAGRMNTVSPVTSILANGLSFTFNPTKFFDGIDQAASPSEYESSVVNLLDGIPSLKLSTVHGLEYYTSNYHFSDLFVPLVHNSHQLPPSVAELNPLIVDINPGDMLYLPTGWFHQVSSKKGKHMAMNFWWKPPNWQDSVKLEEASAAAMNVKVLEHAQRSGAVLKSFHSVHEEM